MRYRITRHDGEDDEITAQEFENYDDAYELLEEIYGICAAQMLTMKIVLIMKF